MDAFEVRTPLRPTKKSKKRKAPVNDCLVEEFLSFGSSNFFNPEGDDEIDSCKSGPNDSIRKERSIEQWLTSRKIFKSPISEKKEAFFEEKRERVNSISYFEFLAESDSTDISPINRSAGITPQSLNLTPVNSKIYQKRSNFASMAEIKMSCLVTEHSSENKIATKLCSKPQAKILSEQKVKTLKEDSQEFEHSTKDIFNKNSELRRCSDL